MKTLFIALFLISTSYASECTYKLGNKNTINWTAYKTMAKAPVSGSFQVFSLNGIKPVKKKSQTIDDLAFIIDARSVFSGNQGRDAKLLAHFFTQNKSILNIKGATKKYSKKQIGLLLTINSVRKEVPMAVTITGNTIKAVGHIDIFDFGLHSSLIAINKACSLLHNGKTWNDVMISFEGELIKECK